MKNVVLGVTGGIAAYKAADLASRLVKSDCAVDVIMTENAQKFITSVTFRALTNRQVVTDTFETPDSLDIEHISLAKRADIFVIAPATANMIGKLASGIADDMLSTTVMATRAPVLIAPAMNTNMYENPIVQDNIRKLKSLGYMFVEPASGRLACGDEGKGKLADVGDIHAEIQKILSRGYDLEGKKFLITAGPTLERIDPVRFISNNSSGKMGYSIAEEALRRGAEVTLISGPTSIDPPAGVNFIRVVSTEDMFNAVIGNIEASDVVIKTAAVLDYTPKEYSSQKIKKNDDNLVIEFQRTKDILKHICEAHPEKYIVGFAAESQNVIENAKGKLENKKPRIVVANDISKPDIGFKSDENEASIVTKQEVIPLGRASKKQIASQILDFIKKDMM